MYLYTDSRHSPKIKIIHVETLCVVCKYYDVQLRRYGDDWCALIEKCQLTPHGTANFL